MKKSKTLDAKDLRILRELENDARKSITSIARKAMVSKDVAIYRIKKLFNEGVIKSIKPIIDTFLLGITTYSIILDLHNLKKNTRKEILENLRSKKNISVNKFLQSDSDLEILIDVKLPGDLYQFYENFLAKYAKFIQKIELSVVTKKHFFGNRYLLNTSNSVILEGTKKFLKIDEKDWDLLEILKKDPRIPVIDIAQKLGISSVSVIRRIRKLKSEGVIRGYLVILDNRAIHRELYKVRVLLRNAS
ncbi:MAG: AsnC family transcriptional regulator, partial [Candidatus Schekmanbacteria bacterium]